MRTRGISAAECDHHAVPASPGARVASSDGTSFSHDTRERSTASLALAVTCPSFIMVTCLVSMIQRHIPFRGDTREFTPLWQPGTTEWPSARTRPAFPAVIPGDHSSTQ